MREAMYGRGPGDDRGGGQLYESWMRTMPRLKDRLIPYLRRWRHRLPDAWRGRLENVHLNLCAIHERVQFTENMRIVPSIDRVFYSLNGIVPSDVKVVVIGNDPYPDPCRATGRSFEQGDVFDWIEGLKKGGRVTPSLLGLIYAAAALNCSDLSSSEFNGYRDILRRKLRNRSVILPESGAMFESLTCQGVLWINQTPTISAEEGDQLIRGSRWKAVEDHRLLHTEFWRPFMCRMISVLVEEARERRIVFALFGDEARKLKRWIDICRICQDVPEENVRMVKSGHPSYINPFFRYGNPLDRINRELEVGRRIRWGGSRDSRTRCAPAQPGPG